MTDIDPTLGVVQAFDDLEDPRKQAGRFQYPLQELLLTALCAVSAGAEDWVDVAEWGEFKLAWLRRFLPFERGMASHDTFSRVFAMLDASRFEACFRRWMASLCPSLEQAHIAVDGKTLRGSTTEDGQVHLVTAWHCGAGVTLGQIKTGAKSNEITAIPELLAGLDLRGATVTMDAMDCQKAIVRQLVDEGADYVIGVKNNQPTPGAGGARPAGAGPCQGRWPHLARTQPNRQGARPHRDPPLPGVPRPQYHHDGAAGLARCAQRGDGGVQPPRGALRALHCAQHPARTARLALLHQLSGAGR